MTVFLLQKTIAPETKRLIIEELHDSKRLYEVLETVNTILTILANHTSPDDASRSIGQYGEEILKCKIPVKVMSSNCTIQLDLFIYLIFRLKLALWET